MLDWLLYWRGNMPYGTLLGQLSIKLILFPLIDNCNVVIKENTLALRKYARKY